MTEFYELAKTVIYEYRMEITAGLLLLSIGLPFYKASSENRNIRRRDIYSEHSDLEEQLST